MCWSGSTHCTIACQSKVRRGAVDLRERACCCPPQAPRAVLAATWPSSGGVALVCLAGDRQRSPQGGRKGARSGADPFALTRCGAYAAPAEREQDIDRQCQKLRAVYQRAKMLAEKETETCLQCLAKVDDLIFKHTGEHMPPPAAGIIGSKRTYSAGHLDGSLNGAGPPKRQMSVEVSHDPMPATPLSRQGSSLYAPAIASKTPKIGNDPQKTAERQVMLLWKRMCKHSTEDNKAFLVTCKELLVSVLPPCYRPALRTSPMQSRCPCSLGMRLLC